MSNHPTSYPSLIQLKKVLQAVYSDQVNVWIFATLAVLFLVSMIAIPVISIPGNTWHTQVNLLTPLNYIVMAMQAVLVAGLMSMQVYLFRSSRNKKLSVGLVGSSGLGGAAGITATLFATASCSSCLFAILGFLGAPTVFFLLSQQWYVVVGATGLLVVLWYVTGMRVVRQVEAVGCEC